MKNEIRLSFENAQNNPKDQKLCKVALLIEDSFIDDLVEGE